MARRGYVKPRKVKERLARRIAAFEKLKNKKGFVKPGSQQGGNGTTVRREEEESQEAV